jgi:hypothetical protein
MKALTVRPPWSWAIARGHKAIENRSWSTTYRGPLAIHAAAKWDDAGEDALRYVVGRIRIDGGELPPNLRADLPYSGTGCVVAIVDLVAICTRARREQDCDCGPWAEPWQAHWHLANPRLHHVPDVRGQLGLWDFDFVEAIREAR